MRRLALALGPTFAMTAILCAPAWGSGGIAAARHYGWQAEDAFGEQEHQAAPQVPAAPQPPALPDLRIASVELSPEIPRHRNRTRIRILVHNDSHVVAAGRIGIQVVHDRASPQPFPVHHELLYLGADELAEVTFDLRLGIDLDSSPYQFFAKVDVFNEVEEADESNNTAWKRVQVCGSPESSERLDGLDNDCNGMIDDGLGLPADPEIALQMLRRLQQQALADSVPLVYALPRLVAPFAVESAVRLSAAGGAYWGLATRGDATADAEIPTTATQTEIRASLQLDDPGNVLTLVDWNGGDVESGDMISLRVVDDRWIVVGGRRATTVAPRRDFFESSRLFTILLIEGETAGAEEAAGATAVSEPRQQVGAVGVAEPVRPALILALAASRHRFVEVRPNDGLLRADARRVGSSTTFVLSFVKTETEPGELR